MSESEQAPGAAGYAVRHFNSDLLPEEERLSVWREEFGRSILNMNIHLLEEQPLTVQARLSALPGLRTISFRGSAMKFDRPRNLLGRGDDTFGLVVNRNSLTSLAQLNREVPLGHGDACAILSDEPGNVASRGCLGLLFQRAPLVARARNIADFALRHVSRESDALRLLMGYLDALPDKLSPGSGKLERTIVDHVYDLAALAICPPRHVDVSSASATAAARLELAMTYLRKHYDFPGLTVSTVAGDQNISARYLQRLIETTGATFSEHLNELRLQRAFALLSDPRYRTKQIAEVALRSGFSDVSYFNRMFRRRFGETPRSVRSRLAGNVRS